MISAIDPRLALADAHPKSGRTEEAASEFEALLIGQMLRLARESFESKDQAGATMFDIADQQLAQMLAKNGGVGLAKLIVNGLKDQPHPVGQALASPGRGPS